MQRKLPDRECDMGFLPLIGQIDGLVIAFGDV
jgi:hypothetical protein